RQLGLADQDLSRHGPHGAELSVLAGRNGAGDLQPLADVTELADALPHLGGRPVDGDLQRNGSVGRIRYRRTAGRGGGLRRGGRRRGKGAGAEYDGAGGTDEGFSDCHADTS